MSEKEKHVAETLAKVLEILPDGKKEYLIGYAEGVTAMAQQAVEQSDPSTTHSTRKETS